MTSSESERRLQSKKEYFIGLDAIQVDSNEEPDTGRQSSTKLLRNARTAKAIEVKFDSSNCRPRSVSDTHLSDLHPKSDSILPSSSRAAANRPILAGGSTSSGVPSKGVAVGMPSSSAIPQQVTGKRKRDANIKLVPAAQQIFSGLNFYFFPPNDKHPARRMRIIKALEYGASWRKDFDPEVTHIIVDKAMKYSYLTKYLKIEAIPRNVCVCSENYPSECISYRTMLSANQSQFKVEGFTPLGVASEDFSVRAEPSKPSTAESDSSLRLKPARKDVVARQSDSPRTDTTASSQPVNMSPMKQTPFQEQGASLPSSAALQAASTDEFDAAMRQARELQHFALDDEDEQPTRPTSAAGPETDGDEESDGDLIMLKKKRSKTMRPEEKWQCMQKHTGKSDNPNAATIAILQQMSEYYDKVGDGWRTRAYRKACGTLRNHPSKVWTKEEAIALPQIGDRLATKIEEIAFTNRLRRLDNARAEPSDQVLQTFMKVYGAGYAKASEWVAQGYTTLDELLAKADLTANQRIGIEHYEDFETRIPRAEVEQHSQIVRKAIQNIDSTFEVIIGGSHRRGAETSGDIDCIITRPETGAAHIRTVVLGQLIPQLTSAGFLVAGLATTHHDGGNIWHGASCLNSKIWRRIDLLFVPSHEIGAALIYFTGNDIFNRSLRLLASTKGMRLNHRGLYKDVMRGKGREKLNEGRLVEGRDEKRIFEVLGVPFRPPEHRIC